MNRGTQQFVPSRGRIVLILTTLAVLAGASFTFAPPALSSTPPAHPLHFNASHAESPSSGEPHSEPIHLLPTYGPHISGQTQTAESSNWSGYVTPGSQISGVSGQWIAPTVKPSQASQSSATWIGIDGVSNTSLIQTGTSQDTSGGTTTYFA